MLWVRKRGKGGWMSIKADMEKAYDRVEWSFVLKVMENFGFSPKWLSWMNLYLSSPQFSILLNGGPYGDFQPSRGLRQADPISPFLFILCLEVLSRLLIKSKNKGLLRGIKLGGVALLYLIYYLRMTYSFCKGKTARL